VFAAMTSLEQVRFAVVHRKMGRGDDLRQILPNLIHRTRVHLPAPAQVKFGLEPQSSEEMIALKFVQQQNILFGKYYGEEAGTMAGSQVAAIHADGKPEILAAAPDFEPGVRSGHIYRY
jgi:hypothetical protein